MPVGIFMTRVAPTRRRQSGEVFDRKSLQIIDVPELSARYTGVISIGGSATPAFSRAMAGSFQLVILPRKMSASTGPLNFSSLETPGMLYTGATAPTTVGRWTMRRGAASSSSSVIGVSVAPKKTNKSVSCRIPPPDPID